MTFRTRTFLGVLVASGIALGVTVVLVSIRMRSALLADIEQGLMNQAVLAADLLSDRAALVDPDGEADRLGRLIGERVTFIAADGHVLGDSEVDAAALGTLENHGTREEVVAAHAKGRGTGMRESHTTGVSTMYAAVLVRRGAVDVVRIALPLTAVEERLALVRRSALGGLGAGLVVALALTWAMSVLLSRRLRVVAATAARYREGDFSEPARDPWRDEVGLIARVLDDTARSLGARLADMAREQAHMDAILNGMVEGVVLVDRAGRLVLTNLAVRNMLRLPSDAEGRHYVEVVRHPAIAAQLARALSALPTEPAEGPLGHDSRRIYVAHVVPVVAERGGGAVLVLHDITQLRRADQVRRDFVANVSHELRTPLTAIGGYVEALLDGTPSDDEAKKFLEIIARHTHRMERLVSDLLRLARLDAGQESIERVACAVEGLVAGAERDVHVSLSKRRQRLAVSIDPDAARVLGDPPKLQDILRNLIENASNYGPDEGTIDVRARRDAAEVEITIADRGPGIPAADLSRIFERFYRVDRSRSRDPGGTGLGLSIVRHLVELHGGRVSAANRDGGGALITVHLPAA